MSKLETPQFKTSEEEAAFGDNLDTAPFMEDDGEWFRFETPNQRAIRVRFSPISQRARAQGVSIETLVKALLIESVQESAATS